MSPHCIFEIRQQWQSEFSRVYSNCCCSCSFEPEIIKIGQSSHKMYSNNIINIQKSTAVLNAWTKKSGNLLNSPRIYRTFYAFSVVYIYIYCSDRHCYKPQNTFFNHLHVKMFKSSVSFRMSGSTWWRKWPIFTQALSTMSLGVLRGTIQFGFLFEQWLASKLCDIYIHIYTGYRSEFKSHWVPHLKGLVPHMFSDESLFYLCLYIYNIMYDDSLVVIY